ncbi:MAG: M56 family metallopeptidase [Planctomycetes bacterium]|nr:M56 family metallopeptidase [Planctomycetota bacterium]
MTADAFLLRLASAAPAALGAWALVAVTTFALRVRDPRFRTALWAWAVADTALALAGWNSAGFVVLRCAVPPRIVDGIAPYALPAVVVWATVAVGLVVRRAAAAFRVASAADCLHALHPATVPAASGVRLALPPGDGTPFVAGVLQPIVVVPRAFWDRLDDGERHAVLAHEVAHVRRLDAVLRFSARIVADVLWFAVPLRWSLVRLDESIEMAADGAAVRRGASSAALARAVVAGALLPRAPAASLAFHGPRGHVARRLDALRRPVSRRVLVAQVAAVVLFAPWVPGDGSAFLASATEAKGTVSVGLQWSPTSVPSRVVAALVPHRSE